MNLDDYFKDARISFDPKRCNHMGKTANECPPCLRRRIAELERQNELLRGLVQSAREYIRVDSYSDGMDDYLAKLQAAIDGGALNPTWQETAVPDGEK